MEDVTRLIDEKFAAFAQQQDATRLYEALDALEAAERALSHDPAARRSAVALRLRFLAALDEYLDPHWDATRRPVVGAPPPPSHSGPVYPTGQVDPRDIADPTERAEYERTLAAGQEYARWYDVQSQLRRIDERAVRFLGLLLAEGGDTPAGRRAFDELLMASPLSEERRRSLRALFSQLP